MIIGIPREIKEHEYRVGISPSGVRELKKEGRRIILEKSAGRGSGFSDEDYRKAGAEVEIHIFRQALVESEMDSHFSRSKTAKTKKGEKLTMVKEENEEDIQ